MTSDISASFVEVKNLQFRFLFFHFLSRVNYFIRQNFSDSFEVEIKTFNLFLRKIFLFFSCISTQCFQCIKKAPGIVSCVFVKQFLIIYSFVFSYFLSRLIPDFIDIFLIFIIFMSQKSLE